MGPIWLSSGMASSMAATPAMIVAQALYSDFAVEAPSGDWVVIPCAGKNTVVAGGADGLNERLGCGHGRIEDHAGAMSH